MKIENQTVAEFLQAQEGYKPMSDHPNELSGHFVFQGVQCFGWVKDLSDHSLLDIRPMSSTDDIGAGAGYSVYRKFIRKHPEPEHHTPPNEEFNVGAQFIKYLNLTSLNLSKLHPDQERELRRAFYGGWGQLLVLFYNNVPNLSDKEIGDFFTAQINQVQKFWDDENK